MRLAALVLLAGCQTIFGLDHIHRVDAGTDGAKLYLDAPPAGTLCAGVANSPLHICAMESELQGVSYAVNLTIDTDNDAMCTRVAPAAGRQGALCELIATDFTLEGTATLTATGTRPLVIVAMGALTIDGTIDVSTHGTTLAAGADDPSCTIVPGPPQAAGANTSGGGAGGSFGGKGGDGGPPYTDPGAVASDPVDPTMLTLVRGGCPGGTGGYDHDNNKAAGGHSGGAVYLMAGSTLTITGNVLANGTGAGGGNATSSAGYPGGGGGGSGGLIMLDTPVLALSGLVMASGGGGGAGGSDNMAPGLPGSDPSASAPTTAAAGGAHTGDGLGGAGGAGSTTQDAAAGVPGIDAPGLGGAGGGGGGGRGVIRVFGSAATGGTVVPTAT